MNQLCGLKGIKREFSNARTPQQNGVAERKNRTLIEAARTMLADSLLPITFWAEAVNTSCYVHNRVLVTKPHNKTPYELLIGRTHIISFMRPFGCPVTILNTLDHIGKFDGKADKGILVGYSINSKAFRVYNSKTKKVEENLHVNFLENKPNVAGIGPKWLFDIDSLTNSMNYQPINAGNRTNGYAGLETNSDAGQARKEKVPDQEYVLLPLLHTSSYVPSSSLDQQVKFGDDAKNINSTNSINTASPTVNTAGVTKRNLQSIFDELVISTPISVNVASSSLGDLNALENTRIFDDAYDDRDEEAMQEELLQFKLLNVWTLVDLPYGKKAIEEEVYVNQPPGFVDPDFLDRVYKVKKALYGLHQAPRAWYETLSTYLMENGFRRGTIDKTLFIKKIKNDILLVQVSMIGSLMYLTSSRPDIMFVVSACLRFQVQPKASHLHAVKRIFRYLKGQSTLGLWYPKDSPLDLIAYSDSDYAGASLDRKSTTRGCQFLGCRLI
ncbi:putative ribonuclease H-like domain-containing protein [Tanacetum coccineum]